MEEQRRQEIQGRQELHRGNDFGRIFTLGALQINPGTQGPSCSLGMFGACDMAQKMDPNGI